MVERTTELRHLTASQVHEISLILQENDGWKHIMCSIPKVYNALACSFDGTVDWERLTDEVGRKYTNDQINRVANPRHGDSRLPAEIFIDEWATSGRKENRPTVGVLLQLLVKAEFFRAADLIAEKWLNEPPPTRPMNGPAAPIPTNLPSALLNEVASFANDSAFQPATEDLLENAMRMNGKLEINQDYYTKYRCDEKKWFTIDSAAPIPAPRKNRKSERPLSQEQTLNHHNTAQAQEAITATMNGSLRSEQQKTTTVNGKTESTEIDATQQLPLLDVFFPQLKNNDEDASDTITTVSTLIEASSLIPLVSALQEPGKSDAIMTDIQNLPQISALNLNGQHDKFEHCDEIKQNGGDVHSEVDDELSNEADDDNDDNEDNSLGKLGSSNNDSSLTNVTGTSGENSFELSSSSTSNENIPLNVLQY